MKIAHILLAIAVMAIWGGNFTVIKIGLEGVSPPLLSCLRFLLAAFPLVFFIPRPAVKLKYIIFFGVTSGILQFSFLFFGMQWGMSAGMASIVLQTQVFFTIVLAALIFSESISQMSIAGIVIALTGLVFVGYSLDSGLLLISFLFVVLSAFFWAVANLITRKAGKIDMVSFITWTSLIPIIPLLLFNLLVYGAAQTLNEFGSMTWKSLFSIFYLAYPTTIIGYGIWSKLISQYGLSKVAPFTLLVPGFGIASAWLFLAESFTLIQVIAVSLIACGLGVHILSFYMPVWNNQKPIAPSN